MDVIFGGGRATRLYCNAVVVDLRGEGVVCFTLDCLFRFFVWLVLTCIWSWLQGYEFLLSLYIGIFLVFWFIVIHYSPETPGVAWTH